jgi:hypothetical protein
VIRAEQRAICILLLHRWQVGLQNSLFFSHPPDSLLWFALFSFNTAEVLKFVLFENFRTLRTRYLAKLCEQQLAYGTATTCIGQLESTILVNSKRFRRLYTTSLRIAGFQGLAHRAVFRTEHRISDNRSVPVLK